MSKVADAARIAVTSEIERLGYELIDVTYAKQYDSMNLTFFIDCDGGVGLDDCEKVHRAIDTILDEADVTAGASYVLNVSSPGLDRPFKTDRDFTRAIGELVEVNLYAPLFGSKKHEGKLISFDADKVTVETKGKELSFERKAISRIRKTIDFSNL